MSERPALDSLFKNPPKETDDDAPVKALVNALRGPKGANGEKGEKGDTGEPGPRGRMGLSGEDGKEGPKGDKGDKGERGERGFTGEEGAPGRDGKDGADGKDADAPEITGKELIGKINRSKEKIMRSKIEGLEDLENKASSTEKRVQNYLSIGGNRNTKLKVGGVLYTGVETISFTSGVTATPIGDGSELQLSVTGGAGSGYQAPTSGVVDGSNAVFVFATAPNAIVVDQGRAMQKTSSDGTVNWTGTTTVTLTIAPTFDAYAIA